MTKQSELSVFDKSVNNEKYLKNGFIALHDKEQYVSADGIVARSLESKQNA